MTRRRLRWLFAGWLALILLAVLLYPRAHYQPGPLLAAHANFNSQCAGCHRPWHGAQNDNCIACHGNFADRNPHGRLIVSSHNGGSIADVTLVAFGNKLSCLSCHTEHRGRHADFHVQAAFACAGCHQHPSIAAVNKHHGATLTRPPSANQMFSQAPFNHFEHKLLIESQPNNFPKGSSCIMCHTVTPVGAASPDQMTVPWRACAPCHADPQDPPLGLPQKLGATPVMLPYSEVIRTRHVNAMFTHSRSHLQTPCAQCHIKVNISTDPTDANSLMVKQCFTCHAHQTDLSTQSQRAAVHDAAIAIGFERVAIAADRPDRVVACGQCHWFHRHGTLPTVDFVHPALKQPPGSHPQGKFAPWLIGVMALAVLGTVGIAYTAFLPAMDERRPSAVTDSAPQRIVKTPMLDDTYQTSIKGLYIVGEMAGTASINLAMRSGRQVIEAIVASTKQSPVPSLPDVCDVLIAGCGPSGLGATATAKALGLRYITLERMTPASTLRTYPRTKLVQATPIDISEYGSFFLEGDATREDLVLEWEKIIAQAGLIVRDREELASISQDDSYFRVKTAQQHEFKARFVVLAMGVRGHPRHLDVPGETKERVYYQLIEPTEFQKRRILIVGGGNSGAEVAQALAEPHLGNTVSYSIFDRVLSNVSHANAEKITALKRSGRITFYPTTKVVEIKAKTVLLRPLDQQAKGHLEKMAPSVIELDNEVIFAMLGAELPTRFLETLGIQMEIRHR